MINFSHVTSPSFIIKEELLRKNLSLLKFVQDQANIEILLAFKAFAVWKTFPIIKKYISGAAISSAWEARLAVEEMGCKVHAYSPAYTEKDFSFIKKCSSHITFNSLSQFRCFYREVSEYPLKISCGLRINPEYSEVKTSLYNPSSLGSRLGIIREELGSCLPKGIEGLHFHTLCESDSFALENTLKRVIDKFGDLLFKIQWINMGGGHLITQESYNIDHLVDILRRFKKKYPHLHIILEPGAAFVWKTGILVASIVDIVQNRGIRTAILDVSFACHMPDCLEMPYRPRIRGAYQKIMKGKFAYRLGGNSCLSGDFVGNWSFDKPLTVGDKIIFEDMIHYTMVKSTFFNGLAHPNICIWKANNVLETYKKFAYKDYKDRIS